MKKLMLITGLIFCTLIGFGQQKALNILGIHQLVGNSQSEHEKQLLARERQSVNTLNEEVNKTMLAKLKKKYREIQERFNFLGTAVLAVNIGTDALPLVNKIASDQIKLYELAKKNPSLLFLAYGTELDFIERSNDLIYFLTGLVASMGTVNQMKVSDRKMLFDFGLDELRGIASLSSKLLKSLEYGDGAQLLRKLSPVQDYINTDKSLVEDIIRNAKYLKQ